jgi:DNA-binding beta-propeller fold protein YncE
MALLVAGCRGSDNDSSSAKNDNGYDNQYDYTYGIPDFPALHNFGVVALNNTGSICILDGSDLKISAPLLTGKFGNYVGGLYDVVISPDGKTTVVSNFGDSMVYFIDTSNPSSPRVRGSAEIGFFAEDMDVTPDGRYLLVTNGGFASRIAVLDLDSQKVVENDAPVATLYHNAVSASPDGRTVITADYYANYVHVFTLSRSGILQYKDSIEADRPVNLTISPDGKTVIVASAPNTGELNYPVLEIKAPGNVRLSQIVTQNAGLSGAQSVAFNQAGNRAYIHCTGHENVIVELQKNFMGKWETGKMIPVEIYGTSHLFGVDTMAMNYRNGYLYVSNPTVWDGTPYVVVVDVNEGRVVKMLDTRYPPESGVIPKISIPTGIAFWNPVR